jgi:hypothetical protein
MLAYGLGALALALAVWHLRPSQRRRARQNELTPR